MNLSSGFVYWLFYVTDAHSQSYEHANHQAEYGESKGDFWMTDSDKVTADMTEHFANCSKKEQVELFDRYYSSVEEDIKQLQLELKWILETSP